MSITIRPATTDELRFVRATWRPQMRPRFRDAEPMGAGYHGHPWGPDRYVGHTALTRLYQEHVERHATTEEVLVAAVPRSSGEGTDAMGWVCRSRVEDEDTKASLCVVRYVYVPKPARGEGLGSAMLRFVRQEARTVSLSCVPECMTAAGAGLWESEKSQ